MLDGSGLMDMEFKMVEGFIELKVGWNNLRRSLTLVFLGGKSLRLVGGSRENEALLFGSSEGAAENDGVVFFHELFIAGVTEEIVGEFGMELERLGVLIADEKLGVDGKVIAKFNEDVLSSDKMLRL